MIKFDILATKTEDYQFAEMVLQVVLIHLSSLMWHISKSLYIINRQNVAVTVEIVGKLDN